MIHNQKEKSITRKRHRNHRDDRTNRHRRQNNCYRFQKLKNIERTVNMMKRQTEDI